MAYMKYKELTKYFNFRRELEIDTLPQYVEDYLLPNEKIVMAYKTRRDKGVFTDKRAILFDLRWFGTVKTIYVVPYKSISTAAITYRKHQASLVFSMDSGYPLKLNFINMSSKTKMHLRKLYAEVIAKNMKN